ncbi:hypothetical protein DFR75_101106 [Nocardia ignorata]|uniref:Uncharacterized protein n=1 Tax=Nocardia ignorata TaxID=145285 RepID=A0A4R6PQW3_NOCIG|nr:hypothetical protein DFR75_101106 [Nocardia ignorata]
MSDNESPAEDVAVGITPSEEQGTGDNAVATPVVTSRGGVGGHQVGLGLELEP